ncbi:AAA family ATPase [Microbacterium sp. gxy059]|uniref:MinD/ParA family ATP-binding protein n=1 Tax=Microbacterium sp. gxy059 TaxID=2957199 RepID=UPI003D970EF4
MRDSSNDDGLNAEIRPDGSAVLVIDETPREIATTHAEDARREIVRLTAEIAAQLDHPVRVVVIEPDGQWPLIVSGDGGVEHASPDPAPYPTRPAAPRPTSPTLPTAAPTTPRPSTPQVEVTPRSTQREFADRSAQRETFLTNSGSDEQDEQPATQGFRGTMTRMGIRMSPGAAERAERADEMAVGQHWPGPRTIAVVNGKGGSGKTPTTILTAAVFARYGGAGVLAWDNNQTRGTLGWRTEKGAHDATLHDMLGAADHLLSTDAQAADVAHYVHHQRRDRFDVLRSQPIALASEQRVTAEDVDKIHAVAARYYRLIVMDSGNDESDPLWRRMIDRTDQLVVATTTRDEHAEAGALLLDALAERDERSAQLAANAVTVVSQADQKAPLNEVRRVIDGYRKLTRDVVQIPFDPAMIDGHLHFGALRPQTQRAWLAATAAIARGLIAES